MLGEPEGIACAKWRDWPCGAQRDSGKGLPLRGGPMCQGCDQGGLVLRMFLGKRLCDDARHGQDQARADTLVALFERCAGGDYAR